MQDPRLSASRSCAAFAISKVPLSHKILPLKIHPLIRTIHSTVDRSTRVRFPHDCHKYMPEIPVLDIATEILFIVLFYSSLCHLQYLHLILLPEKIFKNARSIHQ